MSMEWAVPIGTMKDACNNRDKRDRNVEAREGHHKLKYCTDCSRVYKKADFILRKHRSIREEHYDEGLMPTYGLNRKQCLGCKEKSATTI